MLDLNGTFEPGKKQLYIATLARKIMTQRMKDQDAHSFNSSLQKLRKDMVADLIKKQTLCRFSSIELMNALLKSPVLVGQVSISSTKNGMQLVTAFSEEMQRIVELLLPLASDYCPPIPANEHRGATKVLPFKKAM